MTREVLGFRRMFPILLVVSSVSKQTSSAGETAIPICSRIRAASFRFPCTSYPSAAGSQPLPGVIVVHENRGLVDHIKDVTRRVARAGFVGVVGSGGRL